jgi:hypothetical protein
MSSGAGNSADRDLGHARDVADHFVNGAEPCATEVVYALVEIIERTSVPLDAAVKWRRLTFAREGDFHHWICGIAITKRAVTLVFHFGGILDDPEGRLVAAASTFFRKMEFRSPADVDAQVVLAFVEQAIDRLQYFKDNWKAIQSGAIGL